jgi:hypothetical protein
MLEAEEKVRRMSPERRAALVAESLVRKAKRAWDDPVAFFELVMRDESTQQPLAVPAHQKVFLSFVMYPAHDRAVLILPIGHGKTTSCAGLGLWMLMRNPRMRGLFVSATQQQAKKPLILLRQLIEGSEALRLVAPKLRPSRRAGEPWSDTAITVDRPIGIRDPSFAAMGIDSQAMPGSRIDYVIVDDLLNLENTSSPEQRQATYDKLFGQVTNRLEPNEKSRLIVINTTWHTEDYVNRIAKFMPTLRMSAHGEVWVSNKGRGWDSPELSFTGVIETDGSYKHHLVGWESGETLWPARYDRERLEKEREFYEHTPGMFNRLFLSDPNDDSTALCKKEFVQRCQDQAVQLGVHALVRPSLPDEGPPGLVYDGIRGKDGRPVPYVGGAGDGWWTFTGVDLAVTPDKKGGQTAFFTFAVRMGDRVRRTSPDMSLGGKLVEREVLVDGLCQILDIDIGNWDAMTIIQKLLAKIRAYKSFAAVENNATQEFLIQVARNMATELPIRSHNTTAQGKAHPWQGVVGVFFEMAQGRWLIPTTPAGRVHRNVERFVDACKGYAPTRHTADVLMASYIARALAMKLGALSTGPEGGDPNGSPFRPQLSMSQQVMRR